MTLKSGFVYLYITKRHVCGTCFIASYMALFHVLTTGRWVCVSFRINRELWVGVNRNVVIKSSNQVNKSWVNREAWYSSFTFSTTCLCQPKSHHAISKKTVTKHDQAQELVHAWKIRLNESIWKINNNIPRRSFVSPCASSFGSLAWFFRSFIHLFLSLIFFPTFIEGLSLSTKCRKYSPQVERAHEFPDIFRIWRIYWNLIAKSRFSFILDNLSG